MHDFKWTNPFGENIGKILKCRPYLTQMPGGAGRMPGIFSFSGIILPGILSGT
jgi:hypothetical protein